MIDPTSGLTNGVQTHPLTPHKADEDAKTLWAALTTGNRTPGDGISLSDAQVGTLQKLRLTPGSKPDTALEAKGTSIAEAPEIPAAPPSVQLPSLAAADNSWASIIVQALKSVPAGVAPVIGSRINALPPQFFEHLPPNVRATIQKFVPANASAAVAIILPPDTAQRLQKGGVSDVLLNSTLWLGAVPPSGPVRVFGRNAAYVMTIKLNGNPLTTGNSPTLDFRAGYAFLNDVRPQNILRGQSPIVPDSVSPDTWLFLNAGVSGDFSDIPRLPQIIQQGQNELDQSTQITRDKNGNPSGLDFSVRGGGVVTAGALVRVPGTETLAHRAGQALIEWGGGIADIPTPVTTPVGGIIAAVGVVLNQSTGLYVGPGVSLSKLSFNTKGEVTFGIPGSSYSENLQDAPAAAAEIGENIAPSLTPQLDKIQPSRTTLQEIIDTPTNISDGKPVPNESRLDLYLNKYYKSSPNLDLPALALHLVQAYSAPKATVTQKRNIEYIYNQHPLRGSALLIKDLFGTDPKHILAIPTGESVPDAIRARRKELGEPAFSQRIKQLARDLHQAGLNNNFGIKELADELSRMRS